MGNPPGPLDAAPDPLDAVAELLALFTLVLFAAAAAGAPALSILFLLASLVADIAVIFSFMLSRYSFLEELFANRAASKFLAWTFIFSAVALEPPLISLISIRTRRNSATLRVRSCSDRASLVGTFISAVFWVLNRWYVGLLRGIGSCKLQLGYFRVCNTGKELHN